MGKIIVENVGKAFKKYPTKWSRLLEWMSPLGLKRHSLHWVLRNISFELKSGEAVGIIGINGAGKSTLLKMITGTSSQTSGDIRLEGRVAALLELGMGFHHDFTGRENVYMAGQLLGLSREEIDTLMPEIEEFAEIGDYIDQPARVYSSGMQMRLAFSVATAVRPDILIVDEALSVGDAHFQHKSFNRIRKFNELGTTLLIVSHDKQAIQSICDKAILLNNGEIELVDKPEVVMDYYNALLSKDSAETLEQHQENDVYVGTVSGTKEAEIQSIQIYNEESDPVEVVNTGQRVSLSVDVKVNEDIEKLVFGYSIKDRLGQVVYGTNTEYKAQACFDIKGGDIVKFEVYFDMNIGPGDYSIQTALVDGETHLEKNYEWRDMAMMFKVINKDKDYFIGTCWLDSDIKVLRK